MTSVNWLWLIPILPLIGFLVNGLFRPSRVVAGAVGCAGPFAAFGLSILAFTKMPVEQMVFEWFSVGSMTIHFTLRVDELTGMMILMVTGVGSRNVFMT